jgi:hypothetical protein
VTKVLLHPRTFNTFAVAFLTAVTLQAARAQAENPPEKPAEALYLQLREVGLDPALVYKVRDASIDRSAVHITLEDGTIAFTHDIMGKITGAFFEGGGEVLVVPPSDVERRSMSLFTGMAILEERFATAYFRFNDDLAQKLAPDLRQTENKQEFVDLWNPTAQNLAQSDAMRMLESFIRLLPVKGNVPASDMTGDPTDHFFHARVQGIKLGVFDVYSDSVAKEEVQVGQPKAAGNGTTYYNVWTSFSPIVGGATVSDAANTKPHEDWIAIRHFAISSEVRPPTQIHSRAALQIEVKRGGSRIILFELSRFLQVASVKLAGEPVEFIHNPAVEGTQLARRGNEFLAVILPEPAKTGDKLELEFVYGGEVLAEAGNGLLYVGERGTWYPNRGMVMANFDLNFTYPQEWTLVATGKPVPIELANSAPAAGMQTSHWTSDRPIPFAGFNLGKYKEFKTHAGSVTVETYATPGMERGFPTVPIQTVDPLPSDPNPHPMQVIVPHRSSPTQTEAAVGEAAARAIQYYSQRFGPFPYSQLALTQMPGQESQGWPGLVFLSSYAFLDDEERQQLHFAPDRIWLQQSIPAHETAHQWWGDLIGWASYRDQWFSEGLSNYCALMMLQETNPVGFRQIMDQYRHDLLAKNKDGLAAMDAGPVTLGVRLLSSRFPDGYDAISYGRATWLFHMLRTMLNDAAMQEHPGKNFSGADEPFVRALRRLRERYEGKAITTKELLDVFAEDLPSSLRYEGKSSLDWFLDGWINGTSLPKLELKSVKFTPKGNGLIVSGTILQTESDPNLITSVPVYAVSVGKSVFLGRVFADGEESTFHVSAPAGTHKIAIDPNESVLTAPKK